MPRTAGTHAGQQAQHQSDAAEVVDRDRPLIVMKPILGIGHRTHDRSARIQHQNVRRPKAFEHRIGHRVRPRGRGQITGQSVGSATTCGDTAHHLAELIGTPPGDDDDASRLGYAFGQPPADPA